MKLFSTDDAPTATAPPPVNFHRPWEDVPRTVREAERKMRTVRVLRRFRWDDGVAERGDVLRMPHPDAVSMVRAKKVEPVQ